MYGNQVLYVCGFHFMLHNYSHLKCSLCIVHQNLLLNYDNVQRGWNVLKKENPMKLGNKTTEQRNKETKKQENKK